MTWNVIEANNDNWESCSQCYKQVNRETAEWEWISCTIAFSNGLWIKDIWFCSIECRANYTMQHKDITGVYCLKPAERNPQTWFDFILPNH